MPGTTVNLTTQRHNTTREIQPGGCRAQPLSLSQTYKTQLTCFLLKLAQPVHSLCLWPPWYILVRCSRDSVDAILRSTQGRALQRQHTPWANRSAGLSTGALLELNLVTCSSQQWHQCLRSQPPERIGWVPLIWGPFRLNL